MTTNAAECLLRVTRARTPAPSVRELTLARADGGPLPAFEPGAHVRVRVALPDGSNDWRAYSLVAFDDAAARVPHEYVLSIRLEPEGRGGSRHIHERVTVGDILTVQGPSNDFLLGTHAGCAVLLAGGIGITPLVTMAVRRLALGLAVRLVYAGRSRSQMAYLEPLQQLLGGRLQVHADDEAGGPLDLAAVLGGCGPDDELYVCGPGPMLKAAQAEAEARAWARERVHFEVFAAAAAAPGDRPFQVVLAQSGRTLEVGHSQTLLQCLIDAGCDPLFDCQRGECGVCAVPVLEGAIDHRDHVLSASERTAGKIIQTCVSRAAGTRLVLDL